MTATAEQAYIPGVCNINRAEIASRRKAGYFGLSLLIVVAAVLFAVSANRWIRIVLFVPAFIAAIGYLQSKNHFCVSFAASGLQNATEGSDTATKIAGTAAHTKDKAKARRMNLQAAAFGLVIAALFVAV
jgi:uncharacterized membrane protein (UPF0136 family)